MNGVLGLVERHWDDILMVFVIIWFFGGSTKET